MGKPRKKWTLMEVQALQAGVTKHGEGMWKDILNDPEFSSALSRRTNVNLKDKWRNLPVSTRYPAPPAVSTPAVSPTAVAIAPPSVSPATYTAFTFESEIEVREHPRHSVDSGDTTQPIGGSQEAEKEEQREIENLFDGLFEEADSINKGLKGVLKDIDLTINELERIVDKVL